jgi:hypothetical protein
MADPYWVCDKCGRSIHDGEGAVEIVNNNPDLGATGDMPMEATPDFEGVRDDLGFIDMGATVEARINHPVNIRFQAFHYKCAPKDSQPYSIDVIKAATLEQWVGWVRHVSDKTWIGKTDINNMLDYWWENRGDRVPRP